LDISRYFLIALFGNLFLPSSIGGDVLRIIGLCKNSNQKPKVVASVLLDRLTGFVSIVIISVASFSVGYKLIEDKILAVPILIMTICLFIGSVILFNKKVYHFCCRMFNIFPKFKKKLIEVHDDIELLKDSPAEGFKAIALSCLSQTIYVTIFFIAAKAMHQDIPLIYFFIFVPLICIASSFPSIGGLGVREFGAVYLFSKIGVDSSIAVSLSLLSFIYMVLIGLIGGVCYVFTLSSGRLQYPSSDESADSG